MLLGQDITIGRGADLVSPTFEAMVTTPSASIPDILIGALSGAPAPRPLDVWGAIGIPLAAPATGAAPGDPLLTTYLAFLKAYLQTDGNALPLWNASGVAPGRPVVNGTHPYNPSDAHDDHHGVGFNTKDLPALYLFRDGGDIEWIAEDWPINKSKLTLLWVLPTDQQANQRSRATVLNAMAKVILTGLERGRTPSFVAPASVDPYTATGSDPQAKVFGSYVHDLVNVVTYFPLNWRRARVQVAAVDGSKPIDSYPALEMKLEVHERLELSNDIWTTPTGLQETVTVGLVSEVGNK